MTELQSSPPVEPVEERSVLGGLRRAIRPLIEFAVHVFVGSAIFIVIAIPAVGLNVLVHFLEQRQLADHGILLILRALEYILVGVDAAMFVTHLLVTGYRTARKM